MTMPDGSQTAPSPPFRATPRAHRQIAEIAAREGRPQAGLRLAVEAGWERARSTILAADAVSFLAAFILFIFAIGVVRGFAFALGLTTLVDILVVFLFTKPLMSVLARTKFFGEGHKLSGLDASHLGIEGRKVTEFATAKGGRS